jgi:hypothetical protein
MVSGACLWGVSELSSKKEIARKVKWIGDRGDSAEAARQRIPETLKLRITAKTAAFLRAKDMPGHHSEGQQYFDKKSRKSYRFMSGTA